jgi:hypothetical protein
MIYIRDNFLEEELINILNEDTSEFNDVNVGDKTFWVKLPTVEFVENIRSKIEDLEKSKIDIIFSFFREAKKGQDNDWRIHNDSIINNQQPDRAAVLYISDDIQEGLNGTAFWEHKKYGDRFQKSSPEEFNRILIEDSNNLDLWNVKTIIGHKKNRLISYPCDYFHSKYPNEFNDSRKVFVMFYKINKDERK